jgi:hypothetical protein
MKILFKDANNLDKVTLWQIGGQIASDISRSFLTLLFIALRRSRHGL